MDTYPMIPTRQQATRVALEVHVSFQQAWAIAALALADGGWVPSNWMAAYMPSLSDFAVSRGQVRVIMHNARKRLGGNMIQGRKVFGYRITDRRLIDRLAPLLHAQRA